MAATSALTFTTFSLKGFDSVKVMHILATYSGWKEFVVLPNRLAEYCLPASSL
jgi:hypothetical protein